MPGPEHNSDEETLAYLQTPREEILDQYVTILMSIGENDAQYLQLFQEHLPAIFQFMEEAMKLDFQSMKLTKMIVSMVGDIASTFSGVPNLKAMCQQGYIEQGIMRMQASLDPETKETAQFALGAITKL